MQPFINPKQISLCLLAILLVLAALACRMTPPPEEEQIATKTSVSNGETPNLDATVQAQSAQLTAQAQTIQAPPPGQPLQTEPPAQPMQTEPVQPVQTQPPGQPMLTANVETKCRTGPSADFPVAGYLLVGQQAPVVGRNPDTTWWLIQNPTMQGNTCWIWGETTQLLGDPTQVEVVQPPPPAAGEAPPPDFTAQFANVHDCGGVAQVTFQLGILAQQGFSSSSVSIRDLTADQIISGPETSNNPFLPNSNACPPGYSPAGPGSAPSIGKGIGFGLAAGSPARGIIVLCTEPNLGGVCVEKKVNFTFP